MSNRLQLFRKRMSAFEGTVDPLRAIESGYYVHAPGKLLAETISTRIALRPASSHLLVGGIGSGKTTQLLVACQNIKEVGDIYPIYIDISLYTDISKMKTGVLTAIAGVEISKLIKNNKNQDVNSSIDLIKKIAFGESEEITKEVSFFTQKETKKIKTEGIIPIKTAYGVGGDLVQALKQVAQAASPQYGRIVIFFDGLDRLDNPQIFAQILESDVKAISIANIGLVLIGSLTSLYSNYSDTLENYLDYFYYQPCFDVENDPEAYMFFEKILKTRSEENFIEEDAIDLLIKYSGGVLRDLISLTQASIEETYLSGDDRLQEKHVLTAVNSFGKAQLLGITDEELEILRRTFETKKFVPVKNQNVKLLVTRRILEYRYPKTRYVVHPAIQPIIEQIYA
ncbi:MAG: hypothetical protein ACR9NN_19665 [Nostochopsis sp.]